MYVTVQISIFSETFVPPNVSVRRAQGDYGETVLMVSWDRPNEYVDGYRILFRKFQWVYSGRWTKLEINNPYQTEVNITVTEPNHSYIVVCRGFRRGQVGPPMGTTQRPTPQPPYIPPAWTQAPPYMPQTQQPPYMPQTQQPQYVPQTQPPPYVPPQTQPPYIPQTQAPYVPPTQAPYVPPTQAPYVPPTTAKTTPTENPFWYQGVIPQGGSQQG